MFPCTQQIVLSFDFNCAVARLCRSSMFCVQQTAVFPLALRKSSMRWRARWPGLGAAPFATLQNLRCHSQHSQGCAWQKARVNTSFGSCSYLFAWSQQPPLSRKVFIPLAALSCDLLLFPSSEDCLACPFACLTCLSASLCSSCLQGYRIEAGGCLPCGPDCRTCQSATVCSQCWPRFQVLLGECFPCALPYSESCSAGTQCIAGYYYNQVRCVECEKGKSCLTCTSATQCSECPPGYSLIISNASYCLPACDPNCLRCSFLSLSSGCADCLCLTCFPGYQLANGLCAVSSSLCVGGKYLSSGVCVPGASLLCFNGAAGTLYTQCTTSCQEGNFATGAGAVFGCFPLTHWNGLTRLFLTPLRPNPILTPSGGITQGSNRVYSSNRLTISLPGHYRLSVSLRAHCSSLPCSPMVTFSDNSQGSTPVSRSAQPLEGSMVSYLSQGLPLLQGDQIYLQVAGGLVDQIVLNFMRCFRGCRQCTNQLSCTVCQPPLYMYTGRCLPDCGTLIVFESPETLSVCLVNCPASYYQDQKRCRPCLAPCTLCLSPVQCTGCSPPLFLDSILSTCSESCPDLFFKESISNTCQLCRRPCRLCSSATSCLSCLDFYLSGTACISACPAGETGSNSVCIICSAFLPHCSNCNPSICLACLQSFVLFNGQCRSDCPASYFKADPPACISCQDRLPSCRTCSSQSVCSSCLVGYFLLQNQCRSGCPPGTYPQFTSQACQPCSSQCESCSSSGCLQCKSPLFLLAGTCSSDCAQALPANSYYGQGGVCLPCSSPCLTCSGPSSCLSCLTGFLTSASCLSVCPAQTYPDLTLNVCSACQPPCLSCSSRFLCLNCRTGDLLPTLTCGSCPKGYFAASQQCQLCPSTCLQCTSNVECQRCAEALLLQGSICVQTCTPAFVPVPPDCSPCQPPCRLCLGTITACISCSAGFLLATSCVTTCPLLYYPQSQLGRCVSCAAPCMTCQSSTVCLSCLSGVLLETACQPCSAGLFQEGTACSSCPQHCTSCISRLLCSLCAQSFLIFELGSCVQACPAGYYSRQGGGSCQPCLSPCDTCTSTGCLTCTVGSLVQSTSLCISLCPAGSFSLEKVCKPCDSACATCSESASKCLSCPSPKLYYKSECLQTCQTYCQLNQGAPCLIAVGSSCKPCEYPCRECESSLRFCTTCIQGLYSLNGMCRPGCPSRMFGQEGSCQQCDRTCLSCISEATQCTSCLRPLVLQQTHCLSACQPSFFYSSEANICICCADSCTQCTSLISCQACAIGLLLLAESCVASCTEQYFLRQTRCQSCRSALPHCKTCSSEQNCLSCLSGYFSSAGLCLATCPQYTFPNLISSECSQCSPPCVDCTSATVCTSCQTNFLLLPGGDCFRGQVCPPGYMLQNEVTCTTKCSPGFFLDQQKKNCLPRCPDSSFTEESNCLAQCSAGQRPNLDLKCEPCTACPPPLSFSLSPFFSLSKLTLLIRFSQPVKYRRLLTSADLSITTRSLARTLQAAFQLLQTTPLYITLSGPDSLQQPTLLQLRLPPGLVLGPDGTPLERPLATVILPTYRSSSPQLISAYAPLGQVALVLTTVAAFLALLLILLLRGDFARHLFDHLQHVWLAVYLLPGTQLYSDAWLRGWLGIVYSALRQTAPAPLVPVTARVGVVEPNCSIFWSGLPLLVMMGSVPFFAGAYWLILRCRSGSTSSHWTLCFDLLYLLWWPLLFFSLMHLKYNSDQAGIALSSILVLLCLGFAAATAAYVLTRQEQLLKGQALLTLCRTPRRRVGLNLVLGKFVLKAAIAVVAVALNQHPQYGLSLAIVANAIYCGVLYFYWPFRHQALGWADFTGGVLLLMVLFLASLLHLVDLQRVVNQALGFAIVAVSGMLLVGVCGWLLAVCCLLAKTIWSGQDYFDRVLGLVEQQQQQHDDSLQDQNKPSVRAPGKSQQFIIRLEGQE